MNTANENITSFFEQPSSSDIERYVDINLDISEQVMEHLEKKGWTQKDLASKLGKSEAEVSKWLSGIHNLTLKSISKMESVLGEHIIMTPQVAKKAFSKNNYVVLKVYGSSNEDIYPFKFDDFGQKIQSTSELTQLIA
jgi:ribosome-binding protein aMBF1 (putative translation factor)